MKAKSSHSFLARVSQILLLSPEGVTWGDPLSMALHTGTPARLINIVHVHDALTHVSKLQSTTELQTLEQIFEFNDF
jgi:hypothetical protein